MSDETPIDRAHALMLQNPDDDTLRLRFYERLADAELFMMLQKEVSAADDSVTPEVFELDDARYVLVFDREERLATFVEGIAPFVALSGRNVAAMLDGQDIGLGVNLEVAPSSILLSAQSVSWLNGTLGNAPGEIEAQIAEVFAPKGLPDSLLEAIDMKLATALGLATCAYLVGVTYSSGGRGHLLAFVGALPEAEGALASAAAEALTFSGIEAGAMDVTFLSGSDPLVPRLDRNGLRFDLPQLQQFPETALKIPGSDPEKPPKLK